MNATSTLRPLSWLSGKAFIVGAVSIAQMVLPNTATGLQTGTGGAQTAEYYRDRGARGYPLAVYETVLSREYPVVASSPSEDLARIRSVLGPTVTDLARILKVSRQAIYDWQSGASVAPENVARIADLARAADVFEVGGLAGTPQVLARRIDGHTFFDKVQQGESAEATARSLVAVVRRELQQRQALSDRLKGRSLPSVLTEDPGIPHLSERG